MAEQTVYSKTTRDGRTMEFKVKRYAGSTHIISVYLAGKFFDSGSVLQLRKSPVPGITHCVGKACFTTAEAEILTTALRAADEAYRQSPEGQAEALRNERRNITDEIDGLYEAAQGEFERLHAQEDPTAWTVKNEMMANVEAARAKLVKFDQEHPEVVATLEAERKANVERHIWD